MVISKLIRKQDLKRQGEIIEKLQQEARMLFYDRMMYEVNDSLTSILAVCDVEGRESIPKVKQYIHRVNQSLLDAKNYQSHFSSDKKFNVSLVAKNLIHVIKENYKEGKFACLISDIKAPVQGDQSKFEILFLTLFVSMLLEGRSSESEILIELRQKDQNATLTVLKDSHVFSKKSIERINEARDRDGFKGALSITPHGKGVEVIIKIPLQFSVINISEPLPKEAQKKAPKKVKSESVKAIDDSESLYNEVRFPRFSF
ncbi:hypothetical protein KAR91_17025, partial [Candidatus Pacearchaeota archaeon]|nr:hypothetical protein [Candidatus Pacearchaeota archaeon]